MKAAYLVTESREAANLLQHILPSDLLNTIEVVSAGQKYAAVSFAGTIMSDRSRPVLLIVDGESESLIQARERERSIESMLLPAASMAPYQVYVANPTLSSLTQESLSPDRVLQLQQEPLIQRVIQFFSEVLSPVG
jgi:hypothetical protein